VRTKTTGYQSTKEQHCGRVRETNRFASIRKMQLRFCCCRGQNHNGFIAREANQELDGLTVIVGNTREAGGRGGARTHSRNSHTSTLTHLMISCNARGKNNKHTLTQADARMVWGSPTELTRTNITAWVKRRRPVTKPRMDQPHIL
jgi:hypothetical protein